MRVDERALRASPRLRRMVAACELYARDVKIKLVYAELTGRGVGCNQAIAALGKRFCASRSTIKRALKRIDGLRAELH